MIKLHKKNLLSLANRSIRATGKFKYELARAAFIALLLGGAIAVLINNDSVRESLNLTPSGQNYK